MNKIIVLSQKYWYPQNWITPVVKPEFKTVFYNDTLTLVLGSEISNYRASPYHIILSQIFLTPK